MDSCQSGGCLNRGHLYQSLLPLLQNTKVNFLKDDYKTKMFSALGHEEYIRPLTLRQYQSVPQEALEFSNFRLNIDALLQAQLNRREAEDFRSEIRNQSMFDATVGVLFLLVLAYQLFAAVWEYIDKNWLKRKEEEKVVKKLDEARELYSNLVQVANERV